MSTDKSIPKLSINTRSYVTDKAFENDKFDRKKIALKLTNYLSRLNDGAVLAIDAPWGEGKTWFGRNWNKSLQDKGYKTIYIDAFEQDYIEDPFILITSELLSLIKEESPEFEKFKKSSIEVAKALLPIGTKALLTLGSRALFGSADIIDEAKSALEKGEEVTSQLVSKWMNNKLDSYTTDKITMANFKDQLTEYSKEQEKPLVIFIDELDRCKPTFAVNLIERIKHFFDVQNIVFILLLNRKQLENAIKGVYGGDTDSNKYLDKFINFYFKFPKLENNSSRKELQLKSFISLTMSKYNFEKAQDNDNFILWMTHWSVCFDLSLRDIEKCIALYAFIYPNKKAYILTYFIVLKVKKNNLFEKLLANNIEAHMEVRDLILYLINRTKTEPLLNKHALEIFYEWHNAHCTNFEKLGDKFKNIIESLDFYYIEKENLFKHCGDMIDIDIDIED